MAFLNNLSRRLVQALSTNPTSILSYDKVDGKKPLRVQLRQRTFRIDLNMKEWRTAVELAEDILQPRREQLYRLYHRTMEDGHVLAQVRVARFNVQLAAFEIMKGGKANEEAHAIFEDPWFFRFLRYAVDTELYGHSLVEFSDMDKNGIYQSVHLIPREHVRPEFGEIVINIHDYKGLPYRIPPLSTQALLIEMGDDDDLGLLKAISKAVIRKEYTIRDWTLRNERFGMPFITLKTASRDEKELDEKKLMLENFGSNAWAIVDDEDTIELKESMANTGGAHRSYMDLSESLDSEISLLINGQTGTTEEKAFVGSAEVHERTLNKYTLARMRRIQNDINHKLIPFLTDRLGYPLHDCKLEFKDLREEDGDVADGAMDTKAKPGDPDPAGEPAQKKR